MARDHVDPGHFLAPTNADTSSGGKRWSLPMLADAYGLSRDQRRPTETPPRRPKLRSIA